MTTCCPNSFGPDPRSVFSTVIVSGPVTWNCTAGRLVSNEKLPGANT